MVGHSGHFHFVCIYPALLLPWFPQAGTWQGLWGTCQGSAVASAPGKQDLGSCLPEPDTTPCPIGSGENYKEEPLDHMSLGTLAIPGLLLQLVQSGKEAWCVAGDPWDMCVE